MRLCLTSPQPSGNSFIAWWRTFSCGAHPRCSCGNSRNTARWSHDKRCTDLQKHVTFSSPTDWDTSLHGTEHFGLSRMMRVPPKNHHEHRSTWRVKAGFLSGANGLEETHQGNRPVCMTAGTVSLRTDLRGGHGRDEKLVGRTSDGDGHGRCFDDDDEFRNGCILPQGELLLPNA